MPQIFVSYSRKDGDYVHRLGEALEEKRFSAWIDDRIEYGTEWPRVIEEHIDHSAAFIVVMTPNSYDSEWVQRELNHAQRKGKLIFPLLLEGDEPWLAVATTQYVDVRGGKLPPLEFYELLEGAASSGDLNSDFSTPAVYPKPSGRDITEIKSDLVDILLEVEGIESPQTREALISIGFTNRERRLFAAARVTDNAAADLMAIVTRADEFNKLEYVCKNGVILTVVYDIRKSLENLCEEIASNSNLRK